MIQPPQSWSASRQEFGRTLPLPPLIIKNDNPRLTELADVATTLGSLGLASRSTSPSSSSEYTLMELTPTTSEFQPCRLPSFSETFSDLIAAHNSKPTPKYYDHAPPPLQPRRGSPGSEYSWHGGGGGAGAGGGIGSVPGLSPLSTAHTSPAVSPTTPTYSIPSQTQLEIQVRLGLLGPHHQQDALGHMDMVSNRRLLLARSRRASSAQHHHQQQQQSRRASGTGSVSGGRTASRQPSMTFHNDNHLSHSHDAAAAAGVGDARDSTTDRERHFNQKYKNPDKLFIVYCKDDLRWGWPAIQAQRLPLLPILLGNDYDRSVEERRKVAGLNGMYYRENDLNMPVLTPDGSGLEFVERDGRWWECTRSQKCRTGESNAAGSCGRKGSSTSTKRGSVGGCAADSRPRGMVERYPEEVLLYWDKHVRHFVPEDKRAEVYARAERYCKIRAEQRRQHGIPQWSLDNKDDRVLDLNEPRRGSTEDKNTSSKGRTSLRIRRS